MEDITILYVVYDFIFLNSMRKLLCETMNVWVLYVYAVSFMYSKKLTNVCYHKAKDVNVIGEWAN